MTAAIVINPDFRAKSWVSSAGSMHESPDARRAPVRLTDDFGLPAAEPILIADLLLSLETLPWRDPVVRVAVGLDRIARVHVGHGDRSLLLAPSDARLAAASMEYEQAFAGCMGVGARLREAAMHAEWRCPFKRSEARRQRRPRTQGAAGRTMIAFAVLFGGLVVLSWGAALLQLAGI